VVSPATSHHSKSLKLGTPHSEVQTERLMTKQNVVSSRRSSGYSRKSVQSRHSYNEVVVA
jgi:hypothetical protein